MAIELVSTSTKTADDFLTGIASVVILESY